jgi:1-acyl-sn-glycerol-3-phosphate acyltransferase
MATHRTGGWRMMQPRDKRVTPRYASPLEAIAYAAIRVFAHWRLARAVELRIEGAHWLPREGAAIIAARHYHSLYDGLILLRHGRQPVHLFVALDWVRTQWLRRLMLLACHIARWPAILRADDFLISRGHYRGVSAFRLEEARAMLRAATRLASDLLRAGQTLVVFPEGYPTIEPYPSPKDDGRDFLPFGPGMVKLAQLAQRDGVTRVAIVPAGFVYTRLPGRDRWRVTLRYGEPHTIATRARPDEVAALVARIEADVHALSRPESLSGTDSITTTVEKSRTAEAR